MTTRKTTVPVKFSRSGIQPPVYLAGSFSDPAWQPKLMHFTVDEQNEHKFYAEIEVEEGKEYQYKFRVGDGDWWTLNEELPTVTDDLGNRNNLLAIPVCTEPIRTDLAHKPSVISSTDDTSSPSRTIDTMQTETETRNNDGKMNTGESGQNTTTSKVKGAEAARQLSPPTVIVEKTGSEPRHGDSFGVNATVEQKDAHKMRGLDAEPDQVRVRDEATRNAADTAAEVADSAAALDLEPPTPPITDREAGRIGLRRMSLTPIANVAAVASEVSESAALLDKEGGLPKPPMPPAFVIDVSNVDGEASSSNDVTPSEERAPLFAHESVGSPQMELDEPVCLNGYGGSPGDSEGSSIDLNDPSIEDFPCERHLILERVRTSATRLSEDETVFEGVSASPVVGSNKRVERSEDGSSATGFMTSDARTPSLISIPEEYAYQEEAPPTLRGEMHSNHDRPDLDGSGPNEREELATHTEELEPTGDAYESNSTALQPGRELTRSTVATGGLITPIGIEDVTRKALAVDQGHSKARAIGADQTMDGARIEPTRFQLLPSPCLDSSGGVDGNPERYRDVIPQGKRIAVTVQTATPSSSLKSLKSHPFEKSAVATAKTTAIEHVNDPSQLTSRKLPSPAPERPLTPDSIPSASLAAKSRAVLINFLRLVFVDWIGGMIKRLCGCGRHA